MYYWSSVQRVGAALLLATVLWGIVFWAIADISI